MSHERWSADRAAAAKAPAATKEKGPFGAVDRYCREVWRDQNTPPAWLVEQRRNPPRYSHDTDFDLLAMIPAGLVAVCVIAACCLSGGWFGFVIGCFAAALAFNLSWALFRHALWFVSLLFVVAALVVGYAERRAGPEAAAPVAAESSAAQPLPTSNAVTPLAASPVTLAAAPTPVQSPTAQPVAAVAMIPASAAGPSQIAPAASADAQQLAAVEATGLVQWIGRKMFYCSKRTDLTPDQLPRPEDLIKCPAPAARDTATGSAADASPATATTAP